MNIRIIVAFCLLWFGLNALAQEYTVKSFKIDQSSIDARVNSRVGNDGRKCALLKVYVQDGIDHVNGSHVGDVETRGMEKRIYMAHDSKQVEFVFNNHFPLRIKFDDYNVPALMEQTTYVLTLIDQNTGNTPNGNGQTGTAPAEKIDVAKIKAEADAAYDEGYYDKAYNLYLKISDDAWAANRLGSMYWSGKGVSQDYSEAGRWFRKGAEQGDHESQLLLGIRYFSGNGVAQDYSEAFRWFRKSAEQGNPYGQFYLGIMYEAGCGVAQDYTEAVRWYRKSAEQGNEDAKKALRRLKR